MAADASRLRRMRAFDPYIQRIARMMGLTHWTIKRSDHPAEDGASASARPLYGRYFGFIYLGDEFLDNETPSERRDTVAHELIHFHLSHVDAIAAENLSPEILKEYKRAMEYAVDGMAKAWSSLLPLPPDPKKKG